VRKLTIEDSETRCHKKSPCLNALYLRRDEIPIGVGLKARTLRRIFESISSLEPPNSVLCYRTYIHYPSVAWRPLEHSPAGLEQVSSTPPLIGDVNLFFENPCEDPEFDVELRNYGSESWF
jgi:hypothetical protein